MLGLAHKKGCFHWRCDAQFSEEELLTMATCHPTGRAKRSNIQGTDLPPNSSHGQGKPATVDRAEHFAAKKPQSAWSLEATGAGRVSSRVQESSAGSHPFLTELHRMEKEAQSLSCKTNPAEDQVQGAFC